MSGAGRRRELMYDNHNNYRYLMSDKICGNIHQHLPVSQGRKTLLSSPTCKLSHSRAVADKRQRVETDLTLNSCWILLRLELLDASPSQAITQTQIGLCLGVLWKMKGVLKQSAVNTRHKNLLIGRSIYMSSGLVLLSQMSRGEHDKLVVLEWREDYFSLSLSWSSNGWQCGNDGVRCEVWGVRSQGKLFLIRCCEVCAPHYCPIITTTYWSLLTCTV